MYDNIGEVIGIPNLITSPLNRSGVGAPGRFFSFQIRKRLGISLLRWFEVEVDDVTLLGND